MKLIKEVLTEMLMIYYDLTGLLVILPLYGCPAHMEVQDFLSVVGYTVTIISVMIHLGKHKLCLYFAI